MIPKKLLKMNKNTVWILVLYINVIICNIYVDGLSTINNDRDGRKLFGGYRITPKFCRASKTLPKSDPRSHGPTICMFNHECTQRQGEVVGACMDGFLFGACCQLHGEVDTQLINNNDNIDHPQTNLAAAQSYESYGSQQTYQSNHGGDSNYNEIKLQESNHKHSSHRPTTNNKYGGMIVNNVYESSIDSDSNLGNNVQNNDIAPSSSPSVESYQPQHPPNSFYIQKDSVVVSSPSPEYASSTTQEPTSYYSSSISESSVSTQSPNMLKVPLQDDELGDAYLPPTGINNFSQELPAHIPTGPYGETQPSGVGFTSAEFNRVSDAILNSQSSTFTHSDITHPGVDAILLDEISSSGSDVSGYGGNAPTVLSSTENYTTEKLASSSTERATSKPTFSKPSFRPKPTKPVTAIGSDGNKYVLVQTITHDNKPAADALPLPQKPQGTMSENDIESIESIILMLNDTKTGPQYNADGPTEPYDYTSFGTTYYTDGSDESQTIYGESTKEPTNTAINYDKYGQSSYYITTKLPTGSSTERPIHVQSTIASSYGAVKPEVIAQQQHINIPSSTLRPPIKETNSKRPTLITSASFRPTTTVGTKRPSTSYVYGSPSTTKRPTVALDEIVLTSTTSKKPTTTNKRTKRPNAKTTTQKAPSTSYVTGPTTPRPKTTTKRPTTSYVYSSSTTKRPTTSPIPPKKATQAPPKTQQDKGSTTPAPTIIVLRPTYDEYASSTQQPILENAVPSKPTIGQQNVHVFNDYGTEVPSPTVHITPKPTVNMVTSSTWSQKPNIITKYTMPTKQPSTSYIFSPVVTYRPTFQSSAVPEGSYIISSSYGAQPTYVTSPAAGHYSSAPPRQPIVNDFYDSGYYGLSSTHKPNNVKQTVTTSSVYGVIDDDDYNSINSNNGIGSGSSSTAYPGFFGSSSSYGGEVQQSVEFSTIKNDYYTSPNDLNNFPPVRNPNLNMSASFGTGVTSVDYDISTPEFVEDDVLNDKMGLLVSKIVESLQGNFNELADIVYENKTADSTTVKPTNTKRPTSTTKKPVQKATTKRPTNTRPSSGSGNTRPGTTVAKPGSTNIVTNAKPGVTTTKRPVTRATTKRPTAAAAAGQTTRKTTKKPTTLSVTTKRPLTKLTTATTRRPTTKPPKKSSQTTTEQNDEVEEDEETEEEAVEDVGEEEEDEEEQTTATLGEGRLQCGVRPQVKSGRIVGGKGATFGEFPWQVLVRESTWLGLFTKNKCGGVLITKNYVITAAHCQPGFLASLVAVFGEFDISGDLETKRSVTKNVKRVVVHREYDAATFENDLALLELESPIHYDTHIVPICMPPDTAEFTGRMATVTGWGRLKYGGGVPSVLQEVQVPIIENSVCQEMFHTAGHNKKILPSFLCAGYANGQKDSCEGDSGGPLVLQRNDGRWELAGTVSHGIKCAAPYLPGVYMRTTYYKPWLESVTGVH